MYKKHTSHYKQGVGSVLSPIPAQFKYQYYLCRTVVSLLNHQLQLIDLSIFAAVSGCKQHNNKWKRAELLLTQVQSHKAFSPLWYNPTSPAFDKCRNKKGNPSHGNQQLCTNTVETLYTRQCCCCLPDCSERICAIFCNNL